MTIPLAECVHGHAYRIQSRNLAVGVFNAGTEGFVGIREKFGDRYCFTEYHHDTGTPFGTAIPFEDLEPCPVESLAEGFSDGEFYRRNEELFRWLEAKEIEVAHTCHLCSNPYQPSIKDEGICSSYECWRLEHPAPG